MKSVTFTIAGPPVTKKNSPRIVRAGRDRRLFVIPSETYMAWRERALWQLKIWRRSVQAQMLKLPLTAQYNCAADIYRKRAQGDLINYLQALADVLQDARIVDDDKLIVSWDGSRLLKDAAKPRVVVTLTPLE